MTRAADYISQTLADKGVRHVFMVTGGGAMFLNNAFGTEKRISCICHHHEQACAMAAEGYARVTGNISVINVTSGPGGINALNGVFGAWTDSIPMLVLSGQVRRETLMCTYPDLRVRQLGDQEADIISMVKGITKYAVTVTNPQSIRYHLERAMYLASHGRPGPCWLDIPIDIQSSAVEPSTLPAYNSEEDAIHWDVPEIRRQCGLVLDRFEVSRRPVILAGTGVRLAGAVDVFDAVTHRLGIPVTTAWTHDLIASDDPLFCGRPGTIGTRAGNFVVQNSDALLVIGSRLNIRQTSYNWQSFAHHAYKMQVDVDTAEFAKPTVRPDLPIHCDAKLFLEVLDDLARARKWDAARHREWVKWCRERQIRYPAVTPEQRTYNGAINPYHFMDTLFGCLDNEDVVVAGNASACIISFQTAVIKKGQRLFSNSGSASMGYDMPAAIGAAFARDGKRIVCLAGDGSFQMNIQELQTVAHHHLNIKLFVLNNNGYLSIRTTQRNFFGSFVGESPQSGVTFPDAVAVGTAYGIASLRLNQPDIEEKLKQILALPGPVLCEVMLDPEQSFEPRLSSKQLPDGSIVTPPIEDMFPFLPRKELQENLLTDAGQE
jgi:acetolactate synthase I/II/III large subunit